MAMTPQEYSKNNHAPEGGHTIKISLVWILLGFFLIFAFGIVGGVIGQQFSQPSLPPLISGKNDQMVTTVEQVTISPNTATKNVIEKAQRSVFVLGNKDANLSSASSAIAIGVTSDGVLATAAILPEGPLYALDSEGRQLPVERSGSDALFGITYLRAPKNVIVPLDVAQTDSTVGESLLALSRNTLTAEPRAFTYQINEYMLPAEKTASGIQRLMVGTKAPSDISTSIPLLNEEGRLVGLLTNPSSGLALPVDLIRESFSRFTNGQRELNPMQTLGIEVGYQFVTLPKESKVTFAPVITSVTPNTPAAIAGVERDDAILEINGNAISWQQSIVPNLSKALPLTLKVLRNGEQHTLTLNKTNTSN